nr:general transcription and DNA repair factor IIH subunit TFB2 [Ipomoea batatas]
MPQVRIVAKNFMDMVASLPAMKLDSLYDNPFICEAILRSLPPLAKKYVLQLLYIDSPIAAKSIEEWVLADGSTKHKVAIDRLIQLRLLSETFDSGSCHNGRFKRVLFRYLALVICSEGLGQLISASKGGNLVELKLALPEHVALKNFGYWKITTETELKHP